MHLKRPARGEVGGGGDNLGGGIDSFLHGNFLGLGHNTGNFKAV